VVYSSGVLHLTPDPRASFARIARLARPGGIIVLGVYNSFARLPLRLRRLIFRFSGYRWIPFDPVLHDRRAEPARRAAWLRDQHQHPEEHQASAGLDNTLTVFSDLGAKLNPEKMEVLSHTFERSVVQRAGICWTCRGSPTRRKNCTDCHIAARTSHGSSLTRLYRPIPILRPRFKPVTSAGMY